MTLRRITATALSALMLTGFAAASASAQTAQHHGTRHHSARPHHATTPHHAARPHRAARGGMNHGGSVDRGPTSSDRGAADQLNAQSLEQARSGGGMGGGMSGQAIQ